MLGRVVSDIQPARVEPQQISEWMPEPMSPQGYPVSWLTPRMETPIPWWERDMKSSIKDLTIEKDQHLQVEVKTFVSGGAPLSSLSQMLRGESPPPFLSIWARTRIVNTGEPALIRWKLALWTKRDVRTDVVDCSEVYQVEREWTHAQILDSGEPLVREVVSGGGTKTFDHFTLLADCYAIRLKVTRVNEAR
jgi:hypothetical protein